MARHCAAKDDRRVSLWYTDAMRNQTVPVQKNQNITLEIDALGAEGHGIGRMGEGFVVFVPGALPGERVDALIIKTTAQYAVGKLLRVLHPSEERATPPCPVFGRCGGCQMQHLEYGAQLRFKTAQVADALRTIGGFADARVLPTLGMGDPWRYRNKGIFPVGSTPVPVSGTAAPAAPASLRMGLYAQRSHAIVDVADCPIQPQAASAAMQAVRAWAQECHIAPYDETSHTGLLRAVLVRHFVQPGGTLVAVVTNGERLNHTDKLVAALRAAVPTLRGVVQNVNTERTNVVLGRRERLLWGDAAVTAQLGDLRYDVGSLSFFQVNTQQMKRLYDAAVAAADLQGHELVIDAYCGVGTIGQYLSPKAGKVIGIESVAESVEEARRAAARNGIANAEYLCGHAEDVFAGLAAQGTRPDVILMDPPRKGCDPRFLEAVVRCGAPKLVYVSCNPATFARDARILAQAGYRLGPVQPVDMFPQTADVECVAGLALPVE